MDLHEHAVQAEMHLEQLATGLAQTGVDPSVVATVTKLAEVTRKIVSVLGKGQSATGDQEAPAEDTAPTEEPEPAGGHTMGSATAGLHHDMQRSAAARG